MAADLFSLARDDQREPTPMPEGDVVGDDHRVPGVSRVRSSTAPRGLPQRGTAAQYGGWTSSTPEEKVCDGPGAANRRAVLDRDASGAIRRLRGRLRSEGFCSMVQGGARTRGPSWFQGPTCEEQKDGETSSKPHRFRTGTTAVGPKRLGRPERFAAWVGAGPFRQGLWAPGLTKTALGGVQRRLGATKESVKWGDYRRHT